MDIRQRLSFALATAWIVLAPLASAQTSAIDHAAHHGSTTEAAAELASGEVRRIDKAQKKITLRHGEIKSLDMPPMSMVFQVREAELLDAVKVGDKVLFSVAKEADGTLIVTAIKPAP